VIKNIIVFWFNTVQCADGTKFRRKWMLQFHCKKGSKAIIKQKQVGSLPFDRWRPYVPSKHCALSELHKMAVLKIMLFINICFMPLYTDGKYLN
jgi:hypothetical protein